MYHLRITTNNRTDNHHSDKDYKAVNSHTNNTDFFFHHAVLIKDSCVVPGFLPSAVIRTYAAVAGMLLELNMPTDVLESSGEVLP